MLRMQVGMATARWRWCWMIFITLSFVLPESWSVLNRPKNVNSALNQRVRVMPAQATCGFRSNDIALNSRREAIPCAHGCARNFSIAKRHNRFPLYVEQLGSHPCKLPKIVETATNLTRCFFMRSHDLSTMEAEYTYSIWIKPADTHTEQTIIAIKLFEIVIRDGHLEGFARTNGQPTIIRLTRIRANVWTHVAIRHQRYHMNTIAVFANGVSAGPLLKVFERVISYNNDEDNRIILGTPNSRIQHVGCEIQENDRCAIEGHSPAVKYSWVQKNRSVKMFPLVFSPEYNRTRCERTKDDHLVAKFACAWVFPVCRRNGTVLPPCRSLCLAVMDDWCEDSPRPNVSCDSFPDSSDPHVCVDRNYKPEFQYFKGSIGNGQMFYGQALTDREIEALYLGRLRHVRPLSECLCDGRYPVLQANNSNVCLTAHPSSNSSTPRLVDDVVGTRTRWFLAEYVNDGDLTTAWASAAQFNGSATIQIDVGHLDQLRVVKIHLESYFPRRGILIMAKRTFGFEVVQKLSVNCKQSFGLDTDGDLKYPTQVNCQNLTRLAGGTRHPPYEIVVDFLAGRPRHNPTSQSSAYETRRRRVAIAGNRDFNYFLTTNAIRVVFEGTALEGVSSNIVSEIEVFQRNKCGCYPNGTVDGYLCLDGVCQCRELPGVDVTKAGPKCRPYLARMIPTFGPRAGGTKVVFIGGFLGRENSSVSVRTWVGDIPFDVEYSNETHVYSETPPQPYDGTPRGILYVPTELELTLETGRKLRTKTKFIYKEDPVIERIEPIKSILSGGIQLTVIGRHMDSVAVPVLIVTLVYRGRKHKQTPSPCTVHNSTVIYCPTPKIQLPPEFTARSATLDTSDTTPVMPYGADERVRRNADFKWPAGILNSKDLHFYMGLVLDGVPTYRNISKVLPEFGKLSMFDNPELYEFKEEIRLFRPYSPHDDKHVVIQGDRLNFGCKLEDYTIRLGEGLCPVVELKTNQLLCRPPQPKPPLGTFSKQGAHRVEVNVGGIEKIIGYLRYEEKPAGSWNGIIAAVCVLVLLVLVVLLGVFIYRKRRRSAQRRMKNESVPTVDFDALQQHIGIKLGQPRDIIKALNPSLAAMVQKSNIDSHRMKLGKIIGEGNFGEVHIGELMDKDDKTISELVAIKTVKNADSVRSVSEFLEEATIMHNFDHPNVLSLLGVVIDEGKPYVIMPLMEYGDLRTFIGKKEQSFTVRDLLDFAHQVAKGMAYLEDARFVHRDLAARNCMVNQRRTVKIADFGLARDIYTEDYYRVVDKYRPLPIKWMALEALKHSKFTSKSDVWSYGVVLFELMTRGEKPYCHIDNVDLKRYLEMGRRLEKPDVTPQCIYDLMTRCWLEDPQQRPSFAEICKVLEDIVSDDVDTKDHDYVNDYLVPVELATERPSPKGYLPMSSGLFGQPLDTSTKQRPPSERYPPMPGHQNRDPQESSASVHPPPTGYLPMTGRQTGQTEATEKTDDMHETDQLLGTTGTRDDGLEV